MNVHGNHPWNSVVRICSAIATRSSRDEISGSELPLPGKSLSATVLSATLDTMEPPTPCSDLTGARQCLLRTTKGRCPLHLNIRIYRDKAREWHWTATARNGKKVATCGEGHKNMSHAVDMAERLFAGGPHSTSFDYDVLPKKPVRKRVSSVGS